MPAGRTPLRRTNGGDTDLSRYAGVGMQFAATIGVFAFGGHWLDGRLGSDPWLLILGVFVGFALGLVSLHSKLSPSGGARKPNDDSHPKPEEPR